jgi:hypothetical protein
MTPDTSALDRELKALVIRYMEAYDRDTIKIELHARRDKGVVLSIATTRRI